MMGNSNAAAAASGTSVVVSTTYVRRAHHAGSWYSDDAHELREQLESFLQEAAAVVAAAAAEKEDHYRFAPSHDRPATMTPTAGEPSPPSPRSRLRGIIAPHAGYAYSGRTAAHSYLPLLRELSSLGRQQEQEEHEQQQQRRRLRILLLHPSHHVHMPGRCAVSNASVLETPLGDLTVDDTLRNELLTTIDGVRVMNQHEDEHEHSGEMQLPYLAYCCQQLGRGHEQQVTVTPVMIGSLTTQDETRFGRALSAIMKRPDVITIVSTDFCHWGQRFQFQPLPSTTSSTATAAALPIHQFIEALDRRGMDLIAAQRPGAFAEYLLETRNTICGRHPIAVWLRGLEKVQEDHPHRAAPEASGDDDDGVSIRFTWYAQSSAVQRPDESSVSYAAAIAVQEYR